MTTSTSERLYAPGGGLVPDFNRLNPSPSAPLIIGLAGFAQSGKDEVGRIITRLYGHTQLSFSDTLREFLYAQDLVIPTNLRGGWVYLNDAVDDLGWDEARAKYPFIRRLQQKTGTEAGRKVLHDQVWIDATMAKVEKEKPYVFTSVRYNNEAEAIFLARGRLFRVVRPGVGPVNGHSSDVPLSDEFPSSVILNDGSLVDLEGEVQRVLGEFNA